MCEQSQRHSGSVSKERDWGHNSGGSAFDQQESLTESSAIATLEAPKTKNGGHRENVDSARQAPHHADDRDLSTASAPTTDFRQQYKQEKSSKTEPEEQPKEPVLSKKQRRKLEAQKRHQEKTNGHVATTEINKDPLTLKRDAITQILQKASSQEPLVTGKNQLKGFQRGVARQLYEALNDRQLTEKNIKSNWNGILTQLKADINQLFKDSAKPKVPQFLR